MSQGLYTTTVRGRSEKNRCVCRGECRQMDSSYFCIECGLMDMHALFHHYSVFFSLQTMVYMRNFLCVQKNTSCVA